MKTNSASGTPSFFILLLIACCGAAMPGLAQTTLFSTVGYNEGYAIDSYPAAAAWTQTSTDSGVSIAAEIENGGGTAAGTAYLMNQIGPATTVANQLAVTPFSFTSLSVQPQLVTLFNGLTLGPGTYYLVFAGTSGGPEIASSLNTPIAAPGFSLAVSAVNTYPGTGAAYPPASNFADSLSEYDLQYIVTVPEPRSDLITACGLGALYIGAKSRIGLAGRPRKG